ncbi:hypothetical protein ANO14919_082120 [Xylariales sp. No.14919]|nr:hypothetical protein ANO14919_082120 [Xylariales sp. No.14919]
MNFLEAQDAATLAYLNSDNPIGPPATWRIASSPMELMRRAAMVTRPQGKADAQNAVATFIVPGKPDVVRGVAEAVYQDLKDGNDDAIIDLEPTVPFIRVEAPTEEDALALIRTAQRIAASYLSDDLPAKTLFVEPPANCATSDFQIAVNVIPGTEIAYPSLEILYGEPNPELRLSLDRYKQEISKALCQAFVDASSLHGSLILKIRLGHYLLKNKNYKLGKFTLDNFEGMVKNPRATGELETCLGKAPMEGLSIEAIMRLIQAPGSPCVPLDNQLTGSADVVPTYVFESWHEDDLYETEIEINKNKQGHTHGPLMFNLARTKMISKSAQTPRFTITSIGIGRNLGWDLVGMPGDEKVRASSALQQYLGLGRAEFKGSWYDPHSYPAVHFPENYPLAKKLKGVTVKSIYGYSWKRTGYVVRFAINRRWQNIRDMNRKPPMDTDFDVTIYGDNWDQDSRVRAGETVGKIWGDDLQGLLRDEAGDATGSALSRVQGLVKTIQDIRDFFEGASRIEQTSLAEEELLTWP